jgi:hypothetical protein
MTTYPFTSVEQDAIRALGRSGFCYVHETKKAIAFRDQVGRVAYLNREHSGVAIVVGFGSETSLAGRSDVLTTNLRASSNFGDLPEGLTRNDNLNHQGLQIVLQSTSDIEAVLEALS